MLSRILAGARRLFGSRSRRQTPQQARLRELLRFTDKIMADAQPLSPSTDTITWRPSPYLASHAALQQQACKGCDARTDDAFVCSYCGRFRCDPEMLRDTP